MVSVVDRCKRALITLMHSLAALYGARVNVTRDSPDKAVKTAYRTLSRKVHPDRGGASPPPPPSLFRLSPFLLLLLLLPLILHVRL